MAGTTGARGAALVTGAALRIGREIALELAREGYSVALHYRGSDRAAASLVEEIGALGGQAVALQADLTREAEVAGLVGRAADGLGQTLTALINNASVFEKDDALTATRESWDLHMEANLRAPFVLMQHFARALPERAEGAIVNVLDQRVWSLTPHFVSYTLSKAGLWALTQSMALALAPRIRVNGIGPGPTLRNTRQAEADFEAQWRAVPLGRPTAPAEIAQAVLFLLRTPSVTGQMIALDGGEHLGWAQESVGLTPKE